MRKLIFLLLLIQPAFAASPNSTAVGTGNTPIIVFRGGASRTNEIDYAPASSFNNSSDDIYDFNPVNGDTNAADYLNNSGSYSFNVPTPTFNLAAYQAAKCASISARSDALIFAGFPYDSQVFAFADKDQIRWCNLYIASTAGVITFPYSVLTLSNQPYVFNNSGALSTFYSAGMSFASGIVTSGNSLIAQVMAATNKAGVDAVQDTR